MRLSSKNGMTLPEVVMAAAIGIFLSIGVFAFAAFFQRAQYEYQSNIQLTNDARLVLEKMIWGENISGQVNRRGIAEAAAGVITSPTRFDYTDQDGVAHSVRLNNGSIEYQYGASGWKTLLDPNYGLANDSNEYTVSLEFTAPVVPNSVNIEVVVGRRMTDRWYYGSTSTQVFYRNA